MPVKIEDQLSELGYSSHGSHNSASLLQNTEFYSRQNSNLSALGYSSPTFAKANGDHKFKKLVRQLPPQGLAGILIETFFSQVNWQYDLIDETHFRRQWETWQMVSYADIQEPFGRLEPEVLVFPALLLEVLAQALLFHRPRDERIKSLITVAGMTFPDLAAEYSDTGFDLLTLLGKRNITIATIQAEILHASFLKSRGKVVDAWHVLGATIRDAQEIGLHTRRVTIHQSPPGPEQAHQLSTPVGHKIWVVLHIWDVHMAVVLGRPIATSLQMNDFACTIENDEQRDQSFFRWKSEIDPPRPFDIILAGYNVAYQYFQDIHRLEQSGASIEDYPTVNRIQVAIKMNINLLPSWCRWDNPNLKFDHLHACQWLPIAREGLSSLIHLVLLTLHRPYIFTVAGSRTEALRAGISILRAQERLFLWTEPYQCKLFNPVYASFDAIVLIAAIYLAFPFENADQIAESLEVLERGAQRLGIIGQFNPVAKSAHGVVRSLCHRLKHRLGISKPADITGLSFSNPNSIPSAAYSHPSSDPPSALPFDDVIPPQPTHDLFDGNISIAEFTSIPTSGWLASDLSVTDNPDAWSFQGNFADDSFWNFLNGLNH